MKISRLLHVLMITQVIVLGAGGCQGPAEYRKQADRVTADIIEQKQAQALGKTEPFSIERPSDLLRHRLIQAQALSISGNASLGADQLPLIEHWPEKGYPGGTEPVDPNLLITLAEPIRLSLTEALQVAAKNSFDYQDNKETIFRTALDLDLERKAFRDTFFGQLSYLASTDLSGDRTISGTETGSVLEWNRTLPGGAALSSAIAVDLANLLTSNGASSLGLRWDSSVSIPLLRGSGKHIVQEPLTQAERNVVYAIYKFERFKRTFAVSVAREYFSVLRQMDELRNTEENYKSLIMSARRSRRIADAGRLPEIQVDRAVQDELRARSRWISAQEQLKNLLDEFKQSIGLPPDARIELDRADLKSLLEPAEQMIDPTKKQAQAGSSASTPPADAPIELIPSTNAGAGPMELDDVEAVELALENRLDLRVALGEVVDAQRAVVVAADALGAEFTLFGGAQIGSGRSISSAQSEDAQLHFNRGYYEGLLSLDLPIERTAERNAYRKSFIDLESSVRDVQSLEDSIKLSVRRTLRTLLESRENVKIQAQSVVVAQKRVRSTNMFLEAGDAEIRDVLDAQDDLLSAKNSLTQAVISYRLAELDLQRDMGLLEVDNDGLWREYTPDGDHHVRTIKSPNSAEQTAQAN